MKRRSDEATKRRRAEHKRAQGGWAPLPYSRGSDHASAFRVPRSAFVLLEVVVALGLLVLGMAVIGVQVQNSYRTSVENDLALRAMMLAESRLAQIDSGMVDFDPVAIAAGEPVEEDFGRLLPEYASRVRIGLTAVPDLNAVTLEILYEHGRDPEEDFDFDNAKVLQSVYTLRATPTTIDLQADFGADEEQVTKLTEAFPEGEFDPYAFDPAILANMDLEELVAALPQLLEALGITAEQAARMVPPDVLEMLNEAGFGKEEIDEAAEEIDGAETAGTAQR